MKKFHFCLISLFFTLTLIACSSDDENGAKSEENDSVTEEESNTDNESSDSDTENEEKATGDSEEALKLGETGVVESTLGKYEVTVNSFKTLDEFEGEEPLNELFVLVDFEVTNTGEEQINGQDIYNANLFDEEEFTKENTSYFESIEILDEQLEPGDSAEAQMLFELTDSTYYELVFNFGKSSVSTELTWQFDADQSINE